MNGFIFDLDGVIVDTAIYHYKAWKNIADELGIDFTEQDNEKLKGISRTESFNVMLEIGNMNMSQIKKDEYLNKKNQLFLQYISQLTPNHALEGVKDWLNFLKTKNKKIAIGSSSKNAMLVVSKLGFTHYFDAIVDGTMIEHTKPHPEVFTKCIIQLSLHPNQCVVFEDAIAGVSAAKKAGCMVVGIGKKGTLSDANLVISGFNMYKPETLFQKICKNSSS